MSFLQNVSMLPNSELGNSEMKSIFMDLSNINHLSKKEKYNLLNEQLFKKFILLTQLESEVEFILDDEITLEQLYEQVRKIILKFEYGQRASHTNIIEVYSDTQIQDSMIYILLEGYLQGQLKREQSDQNRIKDNALFRKKIINSHNNEIHINSANDVILIDQENYNKLVSLSEIKFFKFPKKVYTSLRNWITIKNSQINIKFMSDYLLLEPYQVKVHKLHKISNRKLKNNEQINLQLINGLIIIKKGQCKITLVQNDKNCTSKQYQLIVARGTTINNISFGQFNCKQKFKVKQMKSLKQSSIAVINLTILQQLSSEIPQFKQNITKNLKYLEQCRNIYLKKILKNNSSLPIKYQNHKKYASNEVFLQLKPSKSKIHKSSTLTPNYQFGNFYEYIKMIESKQIIAKHKQHQSALKSNIKKTGKIKNMLQKQEQRKKQEMKKMLRLKMRAMAQKSIKINRKSLDVTISNSQNWFKRGLFECDYDDQYQLQKSFAQSSICSKFIKDQIRLSENDTGIINQFSKNCYKYRKEMNNKLNNKNQQIDKESSKLKQNLKRLNNCNSKINQQSKNKKIMKSIQKFKNINCLSELASTAYTSNFNSFQQYSLTAFHQVNLLKQKRQYHSINKDQRKILHRIQSGKVIRTIVPPTIDSYV